MSHDGVFQLQTLALALREQLECRPARVCLLGGGPGAGLEHVDIGVTREVHTLDINADYLRECAARHPQLDGVLRPGVCDLTAPEALLPPCDLLSCNLILEYTGLPDFFALLERSPRPGRISCVIQKNNANSFVSVTETAHKLAALESLHTDIDAGELIAGLAGLGWRMALQKSYALPNGKELLRLDFTPEQD